MSDKVIYNVELTQEEADQIERNREEKIKPKIAPKRQINEKQMESLKKGQERLKSWKQEQKQKREQLKQETTELETKKMEKQIRRKLKEEQALKKLELLKQELENDSSSDEEIIMKKVKTRKPIQYHTSTTSAPQKAPGFPIVKSESAPVSNPRTIKLSEFMRMQGF